MAAKMVDFTQAKNRGWSENLAHPYVISVVEWENVRTCENVPKTLRYSATD
jgi:hypothetical protein